jgi:hypothetical protein
MKDDTEEMKKKLNDDLAAFQAKARDLQEAMRADLHAKAEAAVAAATDAKQGLKATREETSKLTDDQAIKIDIKLLKLEYALAITFWNAADFYHASLHAQRALETADHVLSRLATADARRVGIEEHVWVVTADLAYYLAENYLAHRRREDAERALTLARRLARYFDEASIKKIVEEDKVSLIDNYVFVISRVEPLSMRDRESWRRYFTECREYVKEHLHGALKPERADEIFRSYEQFEATLKPGQPESPEAPSV